jgi:hypothetical protein
MIPPIGLPIVGPAAQSLHHFGGRLIMSKETSKKVATTAGKLLGGLGTSKPVKSVAASDLSQREKGKKKK